MIDQTTLTKNELVIFLGDIQEYLGDLAKNYDPGASLLTRSNYKSALSNKSTNNLTFYTSLGDLPKDLFVVYSDILSQADVIFYRPPEKWSDGKNLDITDPGSSMQGMTETLLLLLPKSVRVDFGHSNALSIHDPIMLVDQRRTNDKQMWVAGCSISHGDGVAPNERYGELLANVMGLPCSFLTRSGSALDWASDQIIRSDIRKNDLVVWGLTHWGRLTYVHDDKLLSGINHTSYINFPEYNSIIDIKNIVSQQTFYNHFYSIQRAINYCEKIGAKLLLVGLLLGNYSLLGFLRSQKNFIHIPYQLDYRDSLLTTKYADLGTDKQHPGPKQHRLYKDIILDFINQQSIQAN